MKNFKYINTVFAQRNINACADYELSLSKLSAITGSNLQVNDEIKTLVSWVRKEYMKINKIYPGDKHVINFLYERCAIGESLDSAMKSAYIYFNFN